MCSKVARLRSVERGVEVKSIHRFNWRSHFATSNIGLKAQLNSAQGKRSDTLGYKRKIGEAP